MKKSLSSYLKHQILFLENIATSPALTKLASPVISPLAFTTAPLPSVTAPPIVPFAVVVVQGNCMKNLFDNTTII